jgi:hypothetical protein
MSTINTSDFNAAVDAVKWTVVMFFRCWNPIMFGLGIVGHSLSIFVFTRPALRSNPCGRYFLASSISGFCVVVSILPLRYLQYGYNINTFTTSVVTCKVLSYYSSNIRYLRQWLKTECIDLVLLEFYRPGSLLWPVQIGKSNKRLFETKMLIG